MSFFIQGFARDKQYNLKEKKLNRSNQILEYTYLRKGWGGKKKSLTDARGLKVSPFPFPKQWASPRNSMSYTH